MRVIGWLGCHRRVGVGFVPELDPRADFTQMKPVAMGFAGAGYHRFGRDFSSFNPMQKIRLGDGAYLLCAQESLLHKEPIG